VDLLAPLNCPPCQNGRHQSCLGWTVVFCGCTAGLCGLRLLTGVMWDIHDEPNGKGEP
jgi:hypothetical protein